ncbi:MAG: 16S rRNA (cytidine(1402)-2'-O)-methyltransferase [Alicyclobacillaceae bacterium]|nr:16S rRNA (cytidine(1402)-2'-O)-methyltransferase [Alicyclobacillaceae bacterium]
MDVRASFNAGGSARLYVCSTPIGNLDDVTNRLLETLRTVDVVAAEDTRHTRKLLSRFDIHPPRLVSFHEHNQRQRVDDFVRWWADGKSIALVSDAGTPLLSDPGQLAVEAALVERVPVVPVPGASAVLAALVASGLPVQPFTFLGFLPRDERQSEAVLQAFRSVPCTLVLYEAPHRLLRTLQRVRSVLSNRRAVLAKELTKVHETFVYGDLDELCQWAAAQTLRGEYVLVIGPPAFVPASEDDAAGAAADALSLAVRRARQAMAGGMSRKEAVRQAAEETGCRRNDVYRALLAADGPAP